MYLNAGSSGHGGRYGDVGDPASGLQPLLSGVELGGQVGRPGALGQVQQLSVLDTNKFNNLLKYRIFI